MEKRGIDISQHQGNIDFDKLKGNIDFAMVRTSYGAFYEDKKYKNVENFLKQAKTDLSTIENNIYQTSEEKIYTRIIELLNAGLWGNIQMNPTRRLSNNLIDKKQRDIEIKNIINEITSLL